MPEVGERAGRHVFISHTSRDDDFVAQLRKALEREHKIAVWADSRELAPGAELTPEVRRAIAAASHVLVVLSPNTVNNPGWVKKEIRAARELAQAQGGRPRVVALVLAPLDMRALELWFEEGTDRFAIAVAEGPDRVQEALRQVLVALGAVLPDDAAGGAAIPAASLDELILELAEPAYFEHAGTRRASAQARLSYRPASAAEREVRGRRFRFVAPLGPIELAEIDWYLERYALWPASAFAERAARTRASFETLGTALLRSIAVGESRSALAAWNAGPAERERRLTIELETDAEPASDAARLGAASELLMLPWEMLREDGRLWLQGARAVSVRRRLLNRRPQLVVAADPPLRVLIASPRAEDEHTTFFDHRSSARPLVEALDPLGELVGLHVLAPPTFPALQSELERARRAGQPYHIVHFDGHGAFDGASGGALCFEDPRDVHKLHARRAQLVRAADLASVVSGHGVPLFFLDACRSARAEHDPTASVAAALVEQGVGSVLAMSRNVLVETTRRLVEVFYRELAGGARIGRALLSAQQALAADDLRGVIAGAGELRLADWFVPVLIQDEHDPQVVRRQPSQAAARVRARGLQNRLGELPATPSHGFVGRSRELLAIERALVDRAWVALRGGGGEGKTRIAVEAARWLVTSRRFERVAFVALDSVSSSRAVVDALGRQLVPRYSVAEFAADELETRALLPLERELEGSATLVVIDNVEAVLGARQQDDRETPRLFAALAKLVAHAPSRWIFTTRESLPAAFDAPEAEIEIGRLLVSEAIELVRTVLEARHARLPAGDGEPELRELVDALGRHARSLVLVAPDLARRGVAATRRNIEATLRDLQARHPSDRERSLYASVELSLQHLPAGMRAKLGPLALFHGGGSLPTIAGVLAVPDDECRDILRALREVGLAEDPVHMYVRFDPALAPYLGTQWPASERADAERRWLDYTSVLIAALTGSVQLSLDVRQLLLARELPNLLHAVDQLEASRDPEHALEFVARLEALLSDRRMRQASEHVRAARRRLAARLDDA